MDTTLKRLNGRTACARPLRPLRRQAWREGTARAHPEGPAPSSISSRSEVSALGRDAVATPSPAPCLNLAAHTGAASVVGHSRAHAGHQRAHAGSTKGHTHKHTHTHTGSMKVHTPEGHSVSACWPFDGACRS